VHDLFTAFTNVSQHYKADSDFMMNCAKNVILLSDFHDGLLNEVENAQVRAHLTLCRLCREISHDLERIISAAAELRDESHVTCPNEQVSWRRFESVALQGADSAGSQQWLWH